MYNKILGCLIGAAAGDAMGAATEARTRDQIIQYFGHLVDDFEIPPSDTFGAGNVKGQVTDDFSSAYFIAKNIVLDGGIVKEDSVKKGLIEWSSNAKFFDRFAGPTTRLAIERYKNNDINNISSGQTNRQATNGAAMKISPIGLLNIGKIDKAIEDAIKVTMLTHDNYLATSGAGAIAAAVSEAATSHSTYYSVIEAGFYGAEQGEKIGKQIARDVVGPSVIKKMQLAIQIGLTNKTFDEKIIEIADLIGTGLHISEAVPSAFGIFASCKGDAIKSVLGGVNAGYDTDTLATISGALGGALQGADAYPEHYLPTLEQANEFEIKWLAEQIYKINQK